MHDDLALTRSSLGDDFIVPRPVYCAFGCVLGGAVLDGAALGFAYERVTPSFSRLLVEPTAREGASSSLNSHHCGTSPCVLDRRFALEAGLSPMIDVPFSSDVVSSHAVVR